MSWCLVKEAANNFITKLKDGTIDINKLADMTSEERHAFFEGIVGSENALKVNSLFESKLILKNKQQGMITWIKKVGGLNKETRRDILSRIERMDKILDPADEEAFMRDLVHTKLGFGVTQDEAKQITTLAQKLEGASKTLGKDRISDYGRSKVALDNYVEGLKPGVKGAKGVIANTLSLQRAIQTGFDISASMRQAAPYFGRKEWFGAVGRGFKYARSDEALDLLKMQIYSDPQFDLIYKQRKNLGLTILGQTFTEREEAFASKWIGKVPGLANSERLYEGTLNDLRYNRFINIVNSAEKAGRPLGDEAVENLAKVIASSTGRGDLGRYWLQKAGNALGTAFFAPKYMISKLDIIADPALRKGARIEAAKNLATLAGMASGLMAMVAASGVKIETSPLSSDFGKAKVGNTRIDLTFGMGQYIRLFSQISANKTKTSSGEMKQLNTGEWGSRTSTGVIGDFFRGKNSPGMALILDLLNRTDYGGNELGIDRNELGAEKNKNTLKRFASMFEPLSAADTIEAYKDASGQTTDFIPEDFANDEGLKKALLVGGLSMVGIGVNTYGGQEVKVKNLFGSDVSDSLMKELNRLSKEGKAASTSKIENNDRVERFKTQVDKGKYEQFLKDVKNEYKAEMEKRITSDKYKMSSDDKKKNQLDDAKSKVLDKWLKKYGYKK